MLLPNTLDISARPSEIHTLNTVAHPKPTNHPEYNIFKDIFFTTPTPIFIMMLLTNRYLQMDYQVVFCYFAF